jgi:hypothetical protein
MTSCFPAWERAVSGDDQSDFDPGLDSELRDVLLRAVYDRDAVQLGVRPRADRRPDVLPLLRVLGDAFYTICPFYWASLGA